MTLPLDKSVLCPVLIGRAAYLDALTQRLDQVRAGRGQIILLAGEAGMGKSRLVAEARRIALEAGFVSLPGSCFESDQVLPYAPLLDLLRTFIAGVPTPEAIAALAPFAPEFVKLLPELISIFPAPVVPSAPLEPEQEKRRHFHTFVQFLKPPAGTTRLIVLEDLHWSDDTSLEFLSFFARSIPSQPILLLLTYRSDEVPPPLRRTLAELDRLRLAVEFPLAHLTPDEVGDMIRAIFDPARTGRAEFAEALAALTDGNPFFVEEVLKSLVAAGDIYLAEAGGWTRKPMHELHIPRTVQDAVQRRTERLSAPARQLLGLAAVAGRRFDFTLLQALTGHAEAELLQLIKDLIAAQLVVEASADHFAFRHALTRQAIYASLLARERLALHRQIAETMEELYGATFNPPLAELAIHFYEAGAWEKALAYARRAGERAQALYAPRAAAEHYTRALSAAHQLSVPVPVELYRACGQMHQTLGDFEAAREDFQAALAAARAQAAAASFPDLHVTTDDLIAEGDQVVERWTQTMTHSGAPFLNLPASGKHVRVTGINIYRIANGKIVEHWGEMNFASVLMQLGVLPMPDQPGL